MENNTNTSAMQRQNDPTPGENGGKLFSQDEVNRIVQTRLAEERAKQSNPTEREQAITARESRLTCREYLLEIGASADLLDVLDTSDPEKFKQTLEKLEDIRRGGHKSGSYSRDALGRPMRTSLALDGYEPGSRDKQDDKIGEAFKADRRYRRT